MSEALVKYVIDMKDKGYSDDAIEQSLLKHYPKDRVDEILEVVEMDESKKDDKISLLMKFIGILIHPKKIFLKIRTEESAHAYYFYALPALILSFLLIGYQFFADGITPGIEDILYAITLLTFIITLPFAVVGFYYIIIRVLFGNRISYDLTMKAIIYSYMQFVIFVILLTPIDFLLGSYIAEIGLYITAALVAIAYLYNLFTQYIALREVVLIKPTPAICTIVLSIIFIGIILYQFTLGFIA